MSVSLVKPNGIIPMNELRGFSGNHCVFALHCNGSIAYINYCRLSELFMMRKPSQNSEVVRLLKQGVQFELQIIAVTTEAMEAMQFAQVYMTENGRPHCNVNGFDMVRSQRRIRCSNGQIYSSQTEAAKALGLTQGAISKCLTGQMGQTGGFRFAWDD